MSEIPRTYPSWLKGEVKSAQKEYTEPTKLLADDGTLLSPGWARHMVFDYDRTKSTPTMRRKEWDFYQISDGRYMIQISFANISIGGYASAALVDLRNPKNNKKLAAGTLTAPTALFLGGKDKYVLPPKGDVPNHVKMEVNGIGKATFDVLTEEHKRTIYFKSGKVECHFEMDIPDGLENITTVLPFKDDPKSYFMTTKQNCMPCSGTYKWGDKVYKFSKDDTFCCLDWGRVNTPYKLVWYWGNGSTYLTDENGNKHIFGFEITWGIGDESNATETCIFYDGKAHKFGAIDVETFPKPDKYMEPWHFVSEDGRFNFVMTTMPILTHSISFVCTHIRFTVCGTAQPSLTTAQSSRSRICTHSANMSRTSGKLNRCEPSKRRVRFLMIKSTIPLTFLPRKAKISVESDNYGKLERTRSYSLMPGCQGRAALRAAHDGTFCARSCTRRRGWYKSELC